MDSKKLVEAYTSTLIQYQLVLKLLHQFEENYSTILRVQILYKSTQRIFLRERLYWNRFFRRLMVFMYQKRYFDIYAGGVIKILMTFFNYLIKEECLAIGIFHQQFKIPSQKVFPMVLDPHQLKFLITNTDFSGIRGSI